MKLINKIRSKKARITVIGLGHVGLPTAAVFADAGFSVKGVDERSEVINAVLCSKLYVKEPGLDELLRKVVTNGRLEVTTDIFQAVKEADAAIICVQTPLDERKQPNLEYLEKACKKVASGLSEGKIVIIESTIPPGTTKKVILAILQEISGLKCGEDFWLAHCPERILSGNALRELVENPRIIGGYTTSCNEIAYELYKAITKGKLLVTDCTTAEVTKLSENAFRDVNIAFANELALICEERGVDVLEVMMLANTHPRVKIHNPGCGVGGPCLPKDPYLLLHRLSRKKVKSKVIIASRRFNDYMPEHMVELVIDAIKRSAKVSNTSKVVSLGVAYKGDSSSAKNSPSEKIISKLFALGVEVVVYDPYSKENFGAKRAPDVFEAVKKADIIMITTDHTMFKQLDLKRIRELTNDKPVIVDGRRIVDPVEAKKYGFYYLGIGYPRV